MSLAPKSLASKSLAPKSFVTDLGVGRTDLGRTDLGRTDPTHKTDRTERTARRTDLGRTDLGRTDLGRTDLTHKTDRTERTARRTDLGKTDLGKTDLGKTDLGEVRRIYTSDKDPEPVAEPEPEPVAKPEAEPEAEAEAEPDLEAEADEESPAQRATYYKRVDAAAAMAEFRSLEKVGGLYAVPLVEPLKVQTPTVVVHGDLADASIKLALPSGFKRFALDIEAAALEAALRNKASWFRRDKSDDSLRRSFKSFVRGGGLKVRVDDDVLAFDEDGGIADAADLEAPFAARCILELSGLCFGRSEFGAMWTLTQLQLADLPRCIIDPSVEPRARPGLENEFA